MAEQSVTEKMSQMQVDAGKTVMFVCCLCAAIFSWRVQLAAS